MAADFAPHVLRLLLGAVYDTDKTQWRELEQLQVSIGQYLAKIGLKLHLDKDQGLAYVTQPAPDEDEYDASQPDLPRLMRRHQLSYELTMLCVALRYHLDRFDQAATDDTRRCFVTRAELRQQLELFARPTTDEAKASKQLDADLKTAERLGFLRTTAPDKTLDPEPRYEICRLVTALISNAKLLDVRDQLRQHLAGPASAELPDEESSEPAFPSL
ncbi:hypothetical protein GCM10028824_18870 [Hymenobacter segetis]|uniref:DUF4194 domain-containing protein n=1 Tax=Hymenobacter segetis TaxID=2025509 RepID=A0ABU9M2B5_9BACT